MEELRVAVIDDDRYRREFMKVELDSSPRISVVHALDQDTASQWTKEQWGQIDVALVDVYDDSAPVESGTDLFSGVGAILQLKSSGIRTIAVTPHRHHPLVEERIALSGAHHVLRRWEINDPRALESAVVEPSRHKRTQHVASRVLQRFGADRADLNRAVDLYVASPLHPRLHEGVTVRELQLSRSAIDRFTESIRSVHFYAPPLPGQSRSSAPAFWPDVKRLLLVLLGRLDAPPSEHDGHDDLWVLGPA